MKTHTHTVSQHCVAKCCCWTLPEVFHQWKPPLYGHTEPQTWRRAERSPWWVNGPFTRGEKEGVMERVCTRRVNRESPWHFIGWIVSYSLCFIPNEDGYFSDFHFNICICDMLLKKFFTFQYRIEQLLCLIVFRIYYTDWIKKTKKYRVKRLLNILWKKRYYVKHVKMKI